MKKINLYISTTFICVSLIASSCAHKKDAELSENETKRTNSSVNTNELLAGTSSKIWRIAKQIDSSGAKERISTEEKGETLNLSKDGNFSITDNNGTATGTWSTEGAHTFVMHFEGKDATESFAILDLSKEKVVLQAADGSEMTLKEK